MVVHTDITNLPLFKNSVITIGTFDGVHTGHLQIIRQLTMEAADIQGESLIITFHPHPRMVINSARQISPGIKHEEIKLLNTLPEKIELLRKQNIGHLVIVPFTLEFSEQSADEYIADFLVSKFHPHTVIIGYDHHFGKNRTGNYKLLELYQSRYNYKVKEIPEHVLHNVTISSTKIRHALEEGDVVTANEYLGYAYFFEGTVIKGDQLGRKLGYPTANLLITDKHKLVPGDGVYAVEVSVNEATAGWEIGNAFIQTHEAGAICFKGMMNIGVRPTLGGTKKVIEVNIFDFDKSIYGQTLRVYVHFLLRGEIKFKDVAALTEQLHHDKTNAIELLKTVQL